jgi:hypothetical protein
MACFKTIGSLVDGESQKRRLREACTLSTWLTLESFKGFPPPGTDRGRHQMVSLRHFSGTRTVLTRVPEMNSIYYGKPTLSLLRPSKSRCRQYPPTYSHHRSCCLLSECSLAVTSPTMDSGSDQAPSKIIVGRQKTFGSGLLIPDGI